MNDEKIKFFLFHFSLIINFLNQFFLYFCFWLLLFIPAILLLHFGFFFYPSNWKSLWILLPIVCFFFSREIVHPNQTFLFWPFVLSIFFCFVLFFRYVGVIDQTKQQTTTAPINPKKFKTTKLWPKHSITNWFITP